MRSIRLFVLAVACVAVPSVFGQVSLPHMEQIYGGTIRQIDMMIPDTNTTVLVVAAESPRALFYGEVDYSTNVWSSMFSGWDIVPDFEGSENHGVPAQIAVHQASQRIFVADESEGLLSCGLTVGSLVTNLPGTFKAVHIEGDVLLAVEVTNDFDQVLWFGTLDGAGTLTPDASAPLPIETESYLTIAIHPTNDLVYLMNGVNPTSFYYSSDTYDLLTNTTTFTEVPLPSPVNTWEGEMRIGFGPDGKMFINGLSNLIVQIGMSTNNGAGFDHTNTGRESAGTTMGLGFEPAGSASSYEMYFGMFVNTNSGNSTDWVDLPLQPGGWTETHINMGAIRVDPNIPELIYVTTDQGTGVSTNSGTTIWENNEGITATHVADLDLALTTKDTAWIATKNGAWMTTNFTTLATWADAQFMDGIVNSIAIQQTDTTYQTVYAGSRRVWKTQDAGGTWEQVYTALLQDGVSGGIDDGWIEDIEVESNRVFAGYHGYFTDEPGGRLAWSQDNGTNWSTIATNLDVTDLLYSYESTTGQLFTSVAFYTNTLPYGIYTYVPGGAAGFTQIFTNEVNITDLEDNPTGTVYAAGVTTGSMPVVYYADPDLVTWTLLPTNGLPEIKSTDGPSDWLGPSLALGTNAIGQQVIYLALETSVWFLPHTGTNTTWLSTPYMQMVDGSRIHVIVWDDLLVGSGTGLYSLDMDSDSDGLSDVEEIGTTFTDPNLADTDADGIGDWEELNKYITCPTNSDTDGDRAIDGDELIAGTSPTNAASVFIINAPDWASSPTGTCVLNWNSVSGKKYTIRKSTNLLSEYSILTNDIEAFPPVNVYTDTVSPPGLFIYQITTE